MKLIRMCKMFNLYHTRSSFKLLALLFVAYLIGTLASATIRFANAYASSSSELSPEFNVLNNRRQGPVTLRTQQSYAPRIEPRSLPLTDQIRRMRDNNQPQKPQQRRPQQQKSTASQYLSVPNNFNLNDSRQNKQENSLHENAKNTDNVEAFTHDNQRSNYDHDDYYGDQDNNNNLDHSYNPEVFEHDVSYYNQNQPSNYNYYAVTKGNPNDNDQTFNGYNHNIQNEDGQSGHNNLDNDDEKDDYERQLEMELERLKMQRMQKRNGVQVNPPPANERDNDDDEDRYSKSINGMMQMMPMNTNIAIFNNGHVAPDSSMATSQLLTDFEEDADDRFITSASGKLRPRFVVDPVRLGYQSDEDDENIDVGQLDFMDEAEADKDEDYLSHSIATPLHQPKKGFNQKLSSISMPKQPFASSFGPKDYQRQYFANRQPTINTRPSSNLLPNQYPIIQRGGRRYKRSLTDDNATTVIAKSENVKECQHLIDAERSATVRVKRGVIEAGKLSGKLDPFLPELNELNELKGLNSDAFMGSNIHQFGSSIGHNSPPPILMNAVNSPMLRVKRGVIEGGKPTGLILEENRILLNGVDTLGEAFGVSHKDTNLKKTLNSDNIRSVISGNLDHGPISDSTSVLSILHRVKRCDYGDDDGDAESVRSGRRWGRMYNRANDSVKKVKKTVKKKKKAKKGKNAKKVKGTKNKKKKKSVKKIVTTKVIKNGQIQSIQTSTEPPTTENVVSQQQPVVQQQQQQQQVTTIPVVSASGQVTTPQSASSGQVYIKTTPAKEVHTTSQTTYVNYAQPSQAVPPPAVQQPQQQQTNEQTVTMTESTIAQPTAQ